MVRNGSDEPEDGWGAGEMWFGLEVGEVGRYGGRGAGTRNTRNKCENTGDFADFTRYKRGYKATQGPTQVCGGGSSAGSTRTGEAARWRSDS